MATELLSSTWEPENFYTAYLTADCTDSDTDIFLDNVPANSEGTLVIDPDSTTNREIIYYSSKTATKVTTPANGRGYDNSTAIAHTTGTKVIMAPIADWFNSLKTLFTTTPQGWSDLADVPDTVTYNGNRSYDLVFNSNDLTDTVSDGMRVKLNRTVTPPTQCTDLESGSSQYWSKSSPTGLDGITSVFTAMAWIKVESLSASMGIVSRLTTNDGWSLRLQSDGTVRVDGRTTSAGADNASSYQSIPLNKWVHVAATFQISSSANTKIYIDGVEVPSAFTNGADAAIGVPAADLEVGAIAGASQFDGKIAQVALFDAVLSASTIKSYASQTLAGNETNCIGLWTFDGDGNDSNANANNLTAQGGAAATTTDSPFNATEYGIITANSFSTNTTLTVQVPEGYAIPTSGGVSSVFYSTQDVPYGFPRDKGKWAVEWLYYNESSRTTSVNTWGALTGINFSVPIGSWKLGFIGSTFQANSSAGIFAPYLAVSTSSSTVSNYKLVSHRVSRTSSTTSDRDWVNMSDSVSLSSATTHYALMTTGAGGGTITVGMYGTIDSGNTIFVCSRFYAECAYV